MVDLPLKGYRILDFCWAAAGPITTRLLADLGAEVIKVESLARLDPIREAGVQPPGMFSLNTNGVFNDCNANKKSITINMNTEAGTAIIKSLVPLADVVTANFTPDQMDSWGLGYPDLRQLRPDIIMASMPVMGSSGPNKDWRAYGSGITAMAGLVSLTGFPERPPIGLGTLHSDFIFPYFAALQIMSALLQRQETGQGQFIDLSQYEVTVHLLDTELIDYLVNRTEPPRRGNRSAEYVPHSVFPCRGEDRWVAIAVRNTLEWHHLCDVMEQPDLATRPDLQTLDGRRAAEAEIEAVLSQWTAARDAWEIAETLQARGVPASPVEDIGDLVEADPAMRDYFVRLSHPEVADILIENEPIIWDGERLPVTLAPLMGEHNEEVLCGLLGLTEEQFAQLLIDKVIY